MKCIIKITWIFIIVLVKSIHLMGQENDSLPSFDTVSITADNMIVFRDSIWIPPTDTVIFIEKGIRYKIRKNPYKTSRSFYDSLYLKANDRKLTRALYRLGLSHRPGENAAEDGEHKVAVNPFEKFEGKTIKKIRFVKVDILEGSVYDTLREASSGFSEFLNNTHINTRDWILDKYMMVEPGDRVNPGVIADNERVIRRLPSIEDVKFIFSPDPPDSDSVELIVITKDIFSIGADASISSFDKFRGSLWDVNAFGLAYELGGSILYEASPGSNWGYELYTEYRNFLGSFVDGSITWLDAFDRKWLRLNVKKDFLTPQTKYGGGLDFGWIKDEYELGNNDTAVQGTFETNYQDIWMGRSFLLGDENKRNNMILSARYERTEYINRPYIGSDSNLAFHNRDIYYGKVSFARFNFYKANMIRSYGIAEDIPYGFTAGYTAGYLVSDFFHRFYSGINMGAGRYLDNFGYFAGNVIVGGFFRSGVFSQGLFESSMLYYTPLLSINRFSTRNFLRLRYRAAVTRDVSTPINFTESIRDLDQDKVGGLSTLVFNYEFVLFSPWYFYGFRFAPFVFADMGLISRSRNAFRDSGFYSAYGIGFRIRNESLAIKSIILSIGFIPRTDSGNSDWFYGFRLGEELDVPILSINKPYILGRDLILPF